MRFVIRLYRFLNILSIDVVAGAIISSLFFAKIFRVQVKPYGLVALGLTVWVIYTFDHLRDAKKIKHRASTQRHRFHQHHFRILVALLCVAVCLDTASIFFIRKQVFEWGFILALAVGLYLIVQHALRFLKELFIASLYTWGVLLLSITVTLSKVNTFQYLLIIQFGLIACINLIMFSWFDQEYDKQDKQNSFVTILGKDVTAVCLYILLGINLFIGCIQLCVYGFLAPVFILLLMNLSLFFVFQFRTLLAKNDLYRLVGDAVFLLPIFYLI